MSRLQWRKWLWVYALLMVVAAFGYARYDTYVMDGDGVAFLDISQYLVDGHAKLAVNGYWNPGYPAVLAAARMVAHPSLWTELAMARYVNVLIFVLTILACLFFTKGLVLVRAAREDGAALPEWAVHLLGLGMLVFSMGRELPLSAVRADTLLLALLLLAAGLVLRLQAGARFWAWPVLGFVLGLAYLVKSFALLPSLILVAALFVYGVTRKGAARTSVAGGAVVAGVLFVALAGPYVLGISKQLGHLSSGDSARLNYCFFVDQTPRWHEAFTGDLGHATGPFKHPEQVLATAPPVFSFAAHPLGTFPLWFDPGWWTVGMTPHFWLKGHIARLVRCSELLLRFLLGRPEIFVLLGVLLAFGATLPKRDWKLWIAPIGWGLVMLGIYFPVDLQDRYLTGPFLLILLPLFAWLRMRADDGRMRVVSGALVVLLAGVALTQATGYLLDVRRHTTAHRGEAGYNPTIYPMARALDALGLQPGDKVACFGDAACYVDPFWARLAGTQVLAEVNTPDEASTLATWNGIADVKTVTGPLDAMGLKFIVAVFPNSMEKPKGWVQLGGTDFFAYRLGR